MQSIYNKVFSDRSLFTQEQQDEFVDAPRVSYEIGYGVEITIFFSTKGRLHRLYLLELPYQSSLLKFGLKQFQLLGIDDEKPITNAARRAYRDGAILSANLAIERYRRDKVAWYAVNVVDAAVQSNEWFRGKLNPWVYKSVGMTISGTVVVIEKGYFKNRIYGIQFPDREGTWHYRRDEIKKESK